MKNILRALAVWFIIGVTGGVAFAEESRDTNKDETPIKEDREQFGNTLFKMPRGWKKVEKSGALLLAPADITEDRKFFVLIPKGQEFTGDFREFFESVLKQGLNAGEKEVESSQITATRANSGYDLLQKAMVIEDESGMQTYRLYLAANPGKRFEMIACVASGKEAFSRYQPGLAEFLQTWRFANVPLKKVTKAASAEPKREAKKQQTAAAETPAPRGKAAPMGLYVANILVNRPKAFGLGYEYRSWNDYWLLLPEGRIYFGLPEGDWSRFDFERARRENPKKCGTYQIVNGEIRLQWQGRDIAFKRGEQTVPVGRGYNGQTGNAIFKKVAQEDGLRFSGTFARRSFTDVSSRVTQGNVSGETRFVFTTDGRFEVFGFIGFAVGAKGDAPASPSGNANVAGSSQRDGAGTYRIHDNTLELIYSDGRRERLTFFRYPGEESKVIAINGANYLRRD